MQLREPQPSQEPSHLVSPIKGELEEDVDLGSLDSTGTTKEKTISVTNPALHPVESRR